MSCQHLGTALVDRARGVLEDAAMAADLDRHMEACAACREAFARQVALTRGLRELAESVGAAEGSPDVAERLTAAFRAHRQVGRKAGWAVRRRALAAAAAVTLVAAAAWFVGGPIGSGGRAPETAAIAPSSPSGGASLEGFIAVPAAAGLPAFESGQIVRIDLPVASLPAYGVEVIPDARAEEVAADVLIGQDGQPRAIRLVAGDES